jgi:hypothetical protein
MSVANRARLNRQELAMSIRPEDDDFHEETDSPTYADDRNFYKVDKWTRDGTKVRLWFCFVRLKF